jgi:serine/threonine-protein kinase HipA
MTHHLYVFHDTDQVGQITLDEKRRWIFQYDAQWLSQSSTFPISIQLPLQEAAFEPDHAKAFFVNLLPEGDVRHLIAKKLQVSEGNDFELLNRLGGECAGALSLYSTPQSVQKNGKYRAISSDEFDQLLDNVSQRPLLLMDEKARLSLAGAQEKIPLYLKENELFFSENGAASTHILKPMMLHFKESVQNEAFCMLLARDIGLHVPDVDVLPGKQGRRAFLIKRYDRQLNENGFVVRLHQEDFCQALGVLPDQKYQNEGGPSLSDCFEMLGQYSSDPAADKMRLIEWAIFNWLIGNCDAHAKNISLLITSDEIRLAPFYDLISTMVYKDLKSTMAMKIGTKYERDEIFERHWIQFSENLAIKPALILQALQAFSKELPKIAADKEQQFVQRYGGDGVVKKIINTIKYAAKRFA